MTEILAIGAFIVAFGTVFLVNDALRKIERKQEATVKQFIDKLTKEIDQNSQAVEEIRKSADDINEVNKSNSDQVADLKTRLLNMEQKLLQATAELEELNGKSKSRRTNQSA